MISSFLSKQFILFLFTGGIAALVNFGSRFLYSTVFSYPVAIIWAYITGMVVAFILFKIVVFKPAKHSVKKQIFYFIVVNLLAIAQTLIISLLLANNLFPMLNINFYPEALAHACGIAVPAITSFIGHSLFSFRQHESHHA
ncbi:MAG: GtrA family protein [Proteobacteria bacterium]|nr:MAG: GtrA family protein [Pseudomonadota bacterium]